MFKDITNQRFGRLTALSVARKVKGTTYWRCLCVCGQETTVARGSLFRPNVSCGCLHREIQRARLTKHGYSNTPEYYAWQAMRQRCENPKNPEYHNYGGRGIKVCERWQSFPNFLADMGKRPSQKYSIERVNNEQGYVPDNCQWETSVAQGNNKRTNHLIEFNGRRLTMSQWATETGISPKTLSARLYDDWTIERALTTPLLR